MRERNEWYREDLVLKSEARTQSELFTDIGNYLFQKNLVMEGFTQAIRERESKYPTGIDLSVVEQSLPNVAIPHTEAKYCKSQVIVFVKLEHRMLFRQMIKPEESLPVRYLFFIVNDVKEEQSTILPNLMDFFTDPAHLAHLESLDTEKELYEYLRYTQRMDAE